MITYRKATHADVPALVNLRTDFLKEVTQADATDPAFAAGLAQYFDEHLLQGDYINWLAADGDDIVGTGGICFYSIPPNFLNISGRRAYILNIYTVAAYRQRGIAKRIFEELMREAHERNVPQISLHATADGKTLYEQFGFREKDNEMVWGKHV